MTNYDFCASFFSTAANSGARILDFGCGSGRVVELLLKQDFDAFGCDTFYAAGDRSGSVSPLLFGKRIFRIENGRIPFPDETFDYIVSNQVFEHVENLDAVLAEVARVLKPDGVMLSVFPSSNVWREGHSGIAFMHWFSKGSTARELYGALFRLLGFGYFKDARSPREWSRHYCSYLDNWTHYRTENEIERIFARYFRTTEHREEQWLDFRLRGIGAGSPPLPAAVKRFVVRKLSGLVLVSSGVRKTAVSEDAQAASLGV